MWKKFKTLPEYVQLIVKYGLFLGMLHVTLIHVLVLTPAGSWPYSRFAKLFLIAPEIWLLVRLLKVGKLAQKKYFDQVINGTLMFGISGLMVGLALLNLTEVLRPGILDQERQAAIEAIQQSNELDDDQKKEYTEIYERELRQPYYAISQFTGITSNGFIFVVILAIFLRHKVAKKEKDLEAVKAEKSA